jgi:hypothetical protein
MEKPTTDVKAMLSGMPCDNVDDPREVAQNELFAEQAEIELGAWSATVPKTWPA